MQSLDAICARLRPPCHMFDGRPKVLSLLLLHLTIFMAVVCRGVIGQPQEPRTELSPMAVTANFVSGSKTYTCTSGRQCFSWWITCSSGTVDSTNSNCYYDFFIPAGSGWQLIVAVQPTTSTRISHYINWFGAPIPSDPNTHGPYGNGAPITHYLCSNKLGDDVGMKVRVYCFGARCEGTVTITSSWAVSICGMKWKTTEYRSCSSRCMQTWNRDTVCYYSAYNLTAPSWRICGEAIGVTNGGPPPITESNTPCANGLLCDNSDTSICQSGQCINQCANVDCGSHGVCKYDQLSGKASCQCDDCYTGTNCEIAPTFRWTTSTYSTCDCTSFQQSRDVLCASHNDLSCQAASSTSCSATSIPDSTRSCTPTGCSTASSSSSNFSSTLIIIIAVGSVVASAAFFYACCKKCGSSSSSSNAAASSRASSSQAHTHTRATSNSAPAKQHQDARTSTATDDSVDDDGEAGAGAGHYRYASTGAGHGSRADAAIAANSAAAQCANADTRDLMKQVGKDAASTVGKAIAMDVGHSIDSRIPAGASMNDAFQNLSERLENTVQRAQERAIDRTWTAGSTMNTAMHTVHNINQQLQQQNQQTMNNLMQIANSQGAYGGGYGGYGGGGWNF